MTSAASRSFFLVALLVGIAATEGCAESEPPVDRVQPNAIEKTALLGEWYFRQTVIDSPYSAGYTFVGEQGDLHKIRWEIQENYLIARRTHEWISGSEGEGITGEATEDGAAVAMYAIQSHFDIRHDYNPTTGEELNVIVENTTDRPWRDRQFMRVDWSQNLITNNDFLVLAKIFDGIESEPVAYYVQNPDPNAPKFEKRPGSDEVYYVDIVNKMFVRPTSVYIDGLGAVPSCFLLYHDHLDCSPGEITVRNSFLKVDPSRDYQPMTYTGDRMERFGYFVTSRPGYDPHYGVVDSARNRFANRHNIWEASHKLDATGALVRCTEENATMVCGGGGSVCDMDWARARREPEGACTIPYRERAIRQIPYYLSASLPADLEADSVHLASEWNRAFVDTIGSLRENECLADGGNAASCAGERDKEDAHNVFVLCHSPVREGEPASCGAKDTVAEIGDLRYSMIGWVSDPHLSSPLGYGPSAADPETGEIIQGNAFVYGAGLETLSSFARDLIALLNRDLSMSEVTSGANVERWVEDMEAPGSEETGRPADDHVIPLDGLDVGRVNQAMDFSWARRLAGTSSSTPPRSPAELLTRFQEAKDRLYRAGAFGRGDERAQARLQNLRDTDIERMLTGPEMRIAAGIDPSLPVTDDVMEQSSPLRGLSLRNMRALDQARARIQRNGCVVGSEFADEGLLGLARSIKHNVDRGECNFEWYGHGYDICDETGALDYEAVRSMIRHPIFDAVTAHEVGHTLGLRHNFSGSYDSLNYNERYWELRNDGTMAPRAWDPMTEAEIDGRIREFQYSTVMDYGNNFVVTDAEGIGHYDEAAIKMGYGDLVEVFTNAENPSTIAWINWVLGAGWPVALKLESFTGGEPSAYAYTDVPQVLGGVDRVQQRADVPYTSLQGEPMLVAEGIRDPLVDRAGRPAVPYLFCSDEQADLGPDCLRYDSGADTYETLQSIIDMYWNYYVFNNFRRQRLGYSIQPYTDRILNRYFAKLQYANQIYALYRPIFEDIFGGSAGTERFFTRPDGMGAWTLGVGAGYQLLTRVVAAPEPGAYYRGVRGDGSVALLPGGGPAGDVSVDALDGRYLETTWDFDAGYFWFDQLDRAGYYYDKVIALQVLVDPETHFLGRDTSADVRRYQLNYYTTFSQSVGGLMRGLLGEDWSIIAPRADATGRLEYPDVLQQASGDMLGTPLDPNASFSIQLYAAVYGMAMIPDTFDQSFLNSSRIFVRGGAEGVTIDPTLPTVEFTDPRSGLTYVAASYLESGREMGVGAQMLNHARVLASVGAWDELASYVDNINVVRRLSWLLGFGG